MSRKLEELGKDWVKAMKEIGLGTEFSVDDVKDCERMNETSLKAQVLELTEVNKALKAQLDQLTEEKEHLNSQLFEATELKTHQTVVETKEVSLDETLHSFGVQDFFNKSSDGYYFNSQKIQLSVEQGKLVVNSFPVENLLHLSFTSGLDRSILGENETRMPAQLLKELKTNITLEEDGENQPRSVDVSLNESKVL
jgi:hypothetical protein